MAIELFGFTIGRTQKEKENAEKVSFALPTSEDGSLDVAGAAGAAYGTYLDMDGSAKSDAELIHKYRQMALFPEAELAIDDIVNEAVVADREQNPVNINLSNVNLSPDIKSRIIENFHEVIHLLNFNEIGYDTFKKWYVDGRLYYHIIIDQSNPKRGILELRPIDALKIKKVRHIIPPNQGVHADEVVMPKVEEYYVFNESGLGNTGGNANLQIAPDSIAYCHSGLLSEDRRMVLSYLHKAITPLNQLRMIDDAVVIYRISRAPERRIFYIDVGNLPKMKAEQYLRDIMTRYKNKMVYDAGTGEIRDDRKHQSMLEDYWLPRREGGRGTEITTLPGGQNLGELADIEYFQSKLYRSLGVPESRIAGSGDGFNLGRSSEILRDELKFSKFVGRLRKRFSKIFIDMLRSQLLLKNIVTPEDWEVMSEHIQFDFIYDNHFAELKDKELMEGRLGLLGMVEPYVGRYYSTEYIRRNVLRQKDAEIVEIDEQIEKEIASGVLPDPNQQMLEMEQGAFGDPMADPMAQEGLPAEPQPQKMPGANEGEI